MRYPGRRRACPVGSHRRKAPATLLRLNFEDGTMQLDINGQPREVEASPDMPLLWALRDLLALTGTKYGCGKAQCGACTVHVDGEPTRSCVLPVSAALGKKITTIEGIGTTPLGRKVQEAWIAEDVPQC